MVALVLLALSLHIRRIYLHGGVKQYDQTMKSQVVKCVKFSTTISFYDAFLHCLQLQLMDLEQRVPLIAAFYQHRVSSSKQSKCCCVQMASLHPGMASGGELTCWEVDLSNYVTVDWAQATHLGVPSKNIFS